MAEKSDIEHSPSFDVDALIAAHAQMVNEVTVIVRRWVSEEFVNVEQALDAVISEFVERLNKLESDCFRERQQDLRDVGRRTTRHLTGSLSVSDVAIPVNSVIVARELLPSEAIELAQSGLTAIVVEHGGWCSYRSHLRAAVLSHYFCASRSATDSCSPYELITVMETHRC